MHLNYQCVFYFTFAAIQNGSKIYLKIIFVYWTIALGRLRRSKTYFIHLHKKSNSNNLWFLKHYFHKINTSINIKTMVWLVICVCVYSIHLPTNRYATQKCSIELIRTVNHNIVFAVHSSESHILTCLCWRRTGKCLQQINRPAGKPQSQIKWSRKQIPCTIRNSRNCVIDMFTSRPLVVTSLNERWTMKRKKHLKMNLQQALNLFVKDTQGFESIFRALVRQLLTPSADWSLGSRKLAR